MTAKRRNGHRAAAIADALAALAEVEHQGNRLCGLVGLLTQCVKQEVDDPDSTAIALAEAVLDRAGDAAPVFRLRDLLVGLRDSAALQ